MENEATAEASTKSRKSRRATLADHVAQVAEMSGTAADHFMSHERLNAFHNLPVWLVLLGPHVCTALVIVAFASYTAGNGQFAFTDLPFWYIGASISCFGLQVTFWSSRVFLPRRWLRSKHRNVEKRSKTLSCSAIETVSQLLAISYLMACLLGQSFFYAWRTTGLILVPLLAAFFFWIHWHLRRSRLHLLDRPDAHVILDSLQRSSSSYLFVHLCIAGITLFFSLDRRNPYLLHSVTIQWADITAFNELPGPCAASAANESYIRAFCPQPILLPYLRASSASGCVEEGEHGGYASQMDLCLASREMKPMVAQFLGLMSVQYKLLILYIMDVWERDFSMHRSSSVTLKLIRHAMYLVGLLELANALWGRNGSIASDLIYSNVTTLTTIGLFFLQLFTNTFPWLGRKLRGDDDDDDKFDIFLSHHWGGDAEGRDNHARVKAIAKGLDARGIKVWLDENMMSDDITNQMSDGIDGSRLVAVFITALYITKVKGLSSKGLNDVRAIAPEPPHARPLRTAAFAASANSGLCTSCAELQGRV